MAAKRPVKPARQAAPAAKASAPQGSDFVKITRDPDYIRLVALRRTLALRLTALVMGGYFSFILLIAFHPALLGTPIAAGSPISVGIPIGLGLIVLSVALTGYYVKKSNDVFDPLTEVIRRRYHLAE